ncbi:MAG: hypothetical protein KAX49_09175 [Halanaerobiales bacterium]|nr:hypothetical protein [Halanaerobiales bacterium]
MKNVEVLIVVDVENALAQGLSSNLYMIDSNKYVGSYREGTNELTTCCKNGQIIKWRVVGVSPDSSVSIEKFSGTATNDYIIMPKKKDDSGEEYWEARVEANGRNHNPQYNLFLNMNGKILSFDPFLNIEDN